MLTSAPYGARPPKAPLPFESIPDAAKLPIRPLGAFLIASTPIIMQRAQAAKPASIVAKKPMVPNLRAMATSLKPTPIAPAPKMKKDAKATPDAPVSKMPTATGVVMRAGLAIVEPTGLVALLDALDAFQVGMEVAKTPKPDKIQTIKDPMATGKQVKVTAPKIGASTEMENTRRPTPWSNL